MSGQCLRKAYIITSLYWISAAVGFVCGQIPGMVGALLKDKDLNLTENEISLTTTTSTIFSLIGLGLAAVTNDKICRRWNFILFSIPLVINWVILYFAYNMLMLMLSRILAGIASGALITLYIAATAEYTSPKTRAFFMNLITTVAPAIGTTLGHYLGIILHWRNVAIIGLIVAILGTVLPLFWIESPQWLATQGRFEECKIAFRKLNHKNEDTEKELRVLIKMENSKIDNAVKTNSTSSFKRFFLALKKRYSWELILHTSVMFLYITAASKFIFSALATVILEEMTGTSDVTLFTLSVDLAMIIGSVLSCVLISRTSLRKLLFTAGFSANVFLIILSMCLYFKSDTLFSRWLNISVLAVYFILINAGPLPIFEALFGEIFPLDLKLYFLFSTWIILVCFLGASLMLLPHMVLLMGYHGFFFLNAVIMMFCLTFLWWKIPETKGKTLQEIEVYFKVKDFDVDKALDDEQIKAMI